MSWLQQGYLIEGGHDIHPGPMLGQVVLHWRRMKIAQLLPTAVSEKTAFSAALLFVVKVAEVLAV